MHWYIIRNILKIIYKYILVYYTEYIMSATEEKILENYKKLLDKQGKLCYNIVRKQRKKQPTHKTHNDMEENL